MPSKLYLNPPTLGEFLFALTSFEENCKESYRKFSIIRDMPDAAIYFKPFTLPENLLDYLRNDRRNFRKLLMTISGGVNETAVEMHRIPHYSPEYENKFYELLSPETTLKHKVSDCKGLAVLCATARRSLGDLVRFTMPREGHIALEEHVNGYWQAVEHLIGPVNRSLPIPNGFNRYYPMILRKYNPSAQISS